MGKLKRITHEELDHLLAQGIVWFYHQKVNGEIKKVLSTKCIQKMPDRVLPLKPNQLGCLTYYDILVGQYRSCSRKLPVWIEE